MNKREFLKTSGALIAGGMFSHLEADEHSQVRTNWAGNYQYRARQLDLPKTVDEVQQIVKSRAKLKVLGSRHSFNSIADTTGDQISLKNLDEITIDEQSRTVRVGGGVTYGVLSPYLDKHGYALHNLASLPHISVAGARSTATHGSGRKNGNLATVVSALELVTGSGEIVRLSREKDGDRFEGAVVDLGGLGVVTTTTLTIQPTYQVSQAVYLNLPMKQLQSHFDEIWASGYSVSLFTDWQNHRISEVWVKTRLPQSGSSAIKSDFFGAKPATKQLHPIFGQPAESTTEQMGIPGPWYERLPHFRMNFTPSAGRELQTEYFVPFEKGYEAIAAVEKLRDHITPHLFVTEIRTIAPDTLWMSPCYKRASMAIHFTWKPDWPAVKDVLPLIESQLAPFDARPHWAKVYTMAPAKQQSLYEKLSDYKKLIKEYDPQEKFRNEYLNTHLFG